MEHTLLLLHGEEIKDSSGKNVPLTNKGVAVSSAQSKFGGKSLYFNGKQSIEANLTEIKGNMTFDFWANFTTLGNGLYCCTGGIMYTDGSNGAVFQPASGTNTLNVFVDYPPNNKRIIKYLSQISTNQWHHYAIVRKDGRYLFFVDGTKKYETETNDGLKMPLNKMVLGKLNSNNSSSWIFGYVDEVRVSDVARWTSDFTPPTEPYGALPDFSYKMQVPVGSSKKLYARLYPQNNDGYFQTDLKGAVVDITLTNP